MPTLSSSATNGPTLADDKLKMALAYTTVTAVWPSQGTSAAVAAAAAVMVPSVLPLQQIGLGSLCSCFARNAQLDLVGAARRPP